LKIAEQNGIRREDIIFFGDGFNDIELMELSGIWGAMGNAETVIKEKADLITDCCNAHGIFILRHVFKIKRERLKNY